MGIHREDLRKLWEKLKLGRFEDDWILNALSNPQADPLEEMKDLWLEVFEYHHCQNYWWPLSYADSGDF